MSELSALADEIVEADLEQKDPDWLATTAQAVLEEFEMYDFSDIERGVYIIEPYDDDAILVSKNEVTYVIYTDGTISRNEIDGD